MKLKPLESLTKRQRLNVAKLFKGGMTMWQLSQKYQIMLHEVEAIIRQILRQQEAK